MNLRALSFRVKVAVACTVSLLAVVFITFALGSYYINMLQKGNVEAAISLAQEQARQLSRDILKLMSGQSDGSVGNPMIRDRIAPMTEVILRVNKSVVWAGVFDAGGNRVISQIKGSEQTIRSQPPGAAPYTAQVPAGGKDNVEVTVATESANLKEITEPIVLDGQQMGEIRLKVTQTPAFQRIETTSHNITRALVLQCALLLGFLILVFWILWRLFSRQLILQQRNAALDRMAYVGTLASGLAHEIRNPLSAMNINLEVVREELADNSREARLRASDLSQRLQNEVLRLNSTLSSFLDFALPNKEGATTFSLRGLAAELIGYHSEQLRHAGVACDLLSPPDSATTIDGDRRLLHQALRNILLNAIQMLDGAVKKQIRVVIQPMKHNWISLTISDTGPGMPLENQKKVFDVFFSMRKGGSGFGLAITRKIIEEHNGRIRAENNMDQRGACFIIELPRWSDTKL